MKTFDRYYRAVAYIEGLMNLPAEKNYMHDRSHPSEYLKRMEYFLGLLDHPEKDFRYIHVTGTAGKGTVTTLLHEILHAAGEVVGSYTSPFVTATIEKIRVGSLYISPDDFADIVERLKPAIDEAYLRGPYGKPSYFEIVLAISLLYFQQMRCTWVVLEVGLGGRYDATNVIQHPVATVITNIDYDHTEVLGKTLQKIAKDKAGIIKPNSLFFTSEHRPSLLKLFKKICVEQGATFHRVLSHGDHRTDNQALVRLVTGSLGFHKAAIAKGIARARLPCRFEVMQHAPLVVFDGAHNGIKIKSTVEHLKQQRFKKLFLIIGIAESKDHLSMLESIIPLADTVYFTRFQLSIRPSASPKALHEVSKKFFKPSADAFILLDPFQALSRAFEMAGEDDCILVTGSFFLAGDLRKRWVSEADILRKRSMC